MDLGRELGRFWTFRSRVLAIAPDAAGHRELRAAVVRQRVDQLVEGVTLAASAVLYFGVLAALGLHPRQFMRRG